ncbi:hypothetical protein ACT6B4_08165 [Campylobacter jejuni]
MKVQNNIILCTTCKMCDCKKFQRVKNFYILQMIKTIKALKEK